VRSERIPAAQGVFPTRSRTDLRDVLILVLATIPALISGAGPARAQSPTPNIVILLADQMRGDAMGCAGHPDVKTPHLDRLAAQGILVPNMFANAPVCSPARATILTGRYPNEHGMICNDLRLRESEITLAEHLKARGYRTGFVGKWHLDGGPRQPGFIPPGPRRQGFDFWAANECSHAHFRNQYFRDEPTPIVMEDYETRVWTDRAIEFIGRAGREPFLLVVAYGPPHDPYRAPEDFRALYDAERLTLPPNWQEGAVTRDQLAHYYGMISDLDAQVGRLMAALDERGLAETTIVWFTSDHGDMLGAHGMRLKRKPWEESIRVPGIVRYPAQVPGGRRLAGFVSHVDMAPTLLGFCGLEIPSAVQGWDLSHHLRGLTDHAPDYVLLQQFTPEPTTGLERPWRAVRTPTHLYAERADGPWLLYDLSNDPYELTNLVARPEAAGIRSQMQQLLTRAMRVALDAWELNEDEFLESNRALYSEWAFYSLDEYRRWKKAAEAP